MIGILFLLVTSAFVGGLIYFFPRTVYEIVRIKIKWYILKFLGIGVAIPKQNFYEVSYYAGEDRYTIRFPKRRGPRKYLYRVEDHNNSDITQKLIEHAGVTSNFHGVPTTPQMLGYEKLTLYFIAPTDADGKVEVPGDIEIRL